MKSLFLVFCLWSALATLTCAGHTGTSPWGFKEYLKRNMHVLFRKLEELDRKVNQQSHSSKLLPKHVYAIYKEFFSSCKIFYAQKFEEVEGHIGLGMSVQSVRLSSA